MVDASIGLGAGKILAVLAVKADHYSVKGSAPSLKDVHCIAVGVAASWTGEAIAEFLLKSVKAVVRIHLPLEKRGGNKRYFEDNISRV
jgi:hypothetical protein